MLIKPRTLLRIEDKTETLNSVNLRDNNPEYIILHSTRSYPEFDDLLKYHRSLGWAGAGYHLFVSDSNKVSQARSFDKEGAHALGFNTRSIGLCFYAQNGEIDKRKINMGKELIDLLKSEYNSDIPVISHTYAQISYFNKLLREFGIDKQFPEVPECVNPDVFDRIKGEVDNLVGSLTTSEYDKIKGRLKQFKNCPGLLFNYFV